MMFTTTVNYVCGLMIAGRWNPIGKTDVPPGGNPASATQRKMAVVISAVASLGLLGFFKYFGFAQRNVNVILALFGKRPLDIMEFVLPTGISFYTFQAMSYTIDVYRGDARSARSLLDFACYVSLFPQLIAGPIVRYRDIAPQLSRGMGDFPHRSHTINKFATGVTFFVLGFAKKILLANPMGEVADAAFGAGSLIWYDAWTGVLAYAFQIYFDFSGYSDMAIGLGLMLGFQFRKNFDSPYKADSMTDFWRRWHISLSSWLRDNLYIPLGGNRRGQRRTYFNLFVVMFLGGLWHGAKWTFVIWGGIHGLLLAYERMIGKDSIYRALPRPLRVMITFIITLITWVFFRADDFTSAIRYLGAMLGLRRPASGAALLGSIIYSRDHLIIFIACAIAVWFGKQSWEIAQKMSPAKVAIMIGLFILALAAMFTQSFNPFLYFQF
jgi:alginate O-acetyltransferase complex protein AlgI